MQLHRRRAALDVPAAHQPLAAAAKVRGGIDARERQHDHAVGAVGIELAGHRPVEIQDNTGFGLVAAEADLEQARGGRAAGDPAERENGKSQAGQGRKASPSRQYAAGRQRLHSRPHTHRFAIWRPLSRPARIELVKALPTSGLAAAAARRAFLLRAATR